jgi:hypothetical protein
LGAAEAVSAPDGVLAFRRTLESEALLCVFELAGRPAEFPVPAPAEVVFAAAGSVSIREGVLGLPAFGGVVLRLGQPA